MSRRFTDPGWRQNMRLKLDVNGMFAGMVGEEHGITREDVAEQQGLVDRARRALKEDRPGFMQLPAGQSDVVEEIKGLAGDLQDRIDNFVVLGIGGSALGNISLQTALNDPYYNYSRGIRNDLPRLFVADNIDPVRMKSLLGLLNLEKTVFNVITKSGGTAETMSNFLIAREEIIKQLGEESLQDHFIATTSRDSGYLIEIAGREGFPTLFIPGDVGGRFSVLTPVGLLSAAVCGIDIEELLAGAAFMAELCENEDLWQNPAYLNGLLQFIAYNRGKNISIMMPYAHSLKDLADWYRQLWAESLGKEVDRNGKRVNVGPTPINALGATDQHSQVQLYMEGPYDKVITFLEVEDYGVEVEIPAVYRDIPGVAYLGNHTLNELIQTEKNATELALTRRGRINTTITLPVINEFTMGQFIYLFELQTAFVGELFNINAFDQPGVELGKHYAYGVLGRDGYDVQREEYQNRPQKNPDLII